MIKIYPVEIRSFRSLSEIISFVDKGIVWYESYLKDYNESLGELLREQGGNPEELEKKLREKGLAKKETAKKGGKKKGATTSDEWFNYKNLLFSAEKQCKAEIFFEAIDKFKNRLEGLKETKNLLGELQKNGLGSDIAYWVYLVEGVPEKIIIEPAGKIPPKVKIEMFMSTSPESLAIMQESVKQKEPLIDAEKLPEDKQNINTVMPTGRLSEQSQPEAQQQATSNT
ncbi:hypothetical protein KEJ18_06330 [Candidatus Bathyarchaeota archaeon]|nr:hypothetical protein [Candidatus Bathyarchaeota archaeon]